MDPVRTLIDECGRRGIHLYLEGWELRYQGPRGAMTARLFDAINDHKDQIIAAISPSFHVPPVPPEPSASGITSSKPTVAPHSPQVPVTVDGYGNRTHKTSLLIPDIPDIPVENNTHTKREAPTNRQETHSEGGRENGVRRNPVSVSVRAESWDIRDTNLSCCNDTTCETTPSGIIPDKVQGYTAELPPSPCPSWTPRPRELAEWPIPLRQRWGERANALEDEGMGWAEAERTAYLEILATLPPDSSRDARESDRRVRP